MYTQGFHILLYKPWFVHAYSLHQMHRPHWYCTACRISYIRGRFVVLIHVLVHISERWDHHPVSIDPRSNGVTSQLQRSSIYLSHNVNQSWPNECAGFSTTCLGNTNDISSTQCAWNRLEEQDSRSVVKKIESHLSLNRCGSSEFRFTQRFH